MCKTGWNVTKFHACHAKRHDNLLGILRRGEVLQLPPYTARPQENQRLETRHAGAAKRAFGARLPPILTLSTRYQTSRTVTMCHACHTQNDMTTCSETSKKERFCSFHRHGEATGKPETRDKTRGRRKTSIWCETSANFHSWKHAKRTDFAASPGDTARP